MANIGSPSPSWRQEQASDDSASDEPTRVDVFRSAVVPITKKHPWKRVVLSLVIIVLLIGIGFGVYWQFFSGKTSSKPYKAPAQTVANNQVATSTTAKNSQSVVTKSYTASDFNLNFNYPDGWTVFNNGSGPMTVTSPSTQLTNATGQKVTGLVIMTIQPQGQLPASFSAGAALAVLNSQLLTYTQPNASQASQAYVSFVQYSSTNTKGGLDGIYLTGNYGYKKDQVIPASNIASVDPLVTVTFTKCGNAGCTSNLAPLTIASADWSKSTVYKPVMAMIASLAFQ